MILVIKSIAFRVNENNTLWILLTIYSKLLPQIYTPSLLCNAKKTTVGIQYLDMSRFWMVEKRAVMDWSIFFLMFLIKWLEFCEKLLKIPTILSEFEWLRLTNWNPVMRRPLFVKAPPPDVWCCCFMSILLLSIAVSWLVPAEPLFRLVCLVLTVYFLFGFIATLRYQTSEIIFQHYSESVK